MTSIMIHHLPVMMTAKSPSPRTSSNPSFCFVYRLLKPSCRFPWPVQKKMMTTRRPRRKLNILLTLISRFYVLGVRRGSGHSTYCIDVPELEQKTKAKRFKSKNRLQLWIFKFCLSLLHQITSKNRCVQ